MATQSAAPAASSSTAQTPAVGQPLPVLQPSPAESQPTPAVWKPLPALQPRSFEHQLAVGQPLPVMLLSREETFFFNEASMITKDNADRYREWQWHIYHDFAKFATLRPECWCTIDMASHHCKQRWSRPKFLTLDAVSRRLTRYLRRDENIDIREMFEGGVRLLTCVRCIWREVQAVFDPCQLPETFSMRG